MIGENFFVTIRRSEAYPVDDAYNRISKDETSWELGSPYFLFLTIQFVVDAYYPLLDKISLNLENLESAVLTGETVAQHAIYHIKYQLNTLRQMLAPQREVLSEINAPITNKTRSSGWQMRMARCMQAQAYRW